MEQEEIVPDLRSIENIIDSSWGGGSFKNPGNIHNYNVQKDFP